jgi:hypothetical protein
MMSADTATIALEAYLRRAKAAEDVILREHADLLTRIQTLAANSPISDASFVAGTLALARRILTE